MNALRSVLPPSLATATREQIRAYFLDGWRLEELLFSSIADERGFLERGDDLRHPLAFYLGHSAAFYVNKLASALPDRIDPALELLFASGVDPEHPGDLRDVAWPELVEIRVFRSRVFEQVLAWIDSHPIEHPIRKGSPLWALMMAMEHQRIHFETSSVILRQLPARYLRKPDGWTYAPSGRSAPPNELVRIPGGLASMGKSPSSPIYGWDNEYGALKEFVPSFLVTRQLVSNAEFIGFVESGGYDDAALWGGEGWAWKNRVGARHPRFWSRRDGAWAYRTLFEWIAMPLDWPIEVNYHEAKAFANWKGADYRLPTEAEFRRLSQPGGVSIHSPANLHLAFGSPSPVDLHNDPHHGISDASGNVWQWLENDFYPLPGFEIDPLYPDFSQPYFGERHKMMLGGSWITTGTGASPFYRLWFRKHFYQHAGFRLIKQEG